MVDDWLVPLVFLLIALAFSALWLRMRARRRAELRASARTDTLEEADAVVELRDDEPLEIAAVRAELARVRAEEEAGRMKGTPSALPEAVSAADPEAEAEAPRPDGGTVTKETPPDGTVSEGPPHATATAATGAADAQERPEDALDPAVSEEPGTSDPTPDDDREAGGDRYDDEGRLILPIVTGDVIVVTDVPRHIQLTVTRQWPIPRVQGFRPGAERLSVAYDGREPTDVVMLPTVDGYLQVNLGGRPVVQVECADGPDALASALTINP